MSGIPLWMVVPLCFISMWLGLGIGWLVHSMFEADNQREEIENV